jgi:hypothetical protein
MNDMLHAKSNKELAKHLRKMTKMALDNNSGEMVLKRRFITKIWPISRRWESFSSEWWLDFRPGSREMNGVNINEYNVSSNAYLVNREETWIGK